MIPTLKGQNVSLLLYLSSLNACLIEKAVILLNWTLKLLGRVFISSTYLAIVKTCFGVSIDPVKMGHLSCVIKTMNGNKVFALSPTTGFSVFDLLSNRFKLFPVIIYTLIKFIDNVLK